MGDGGGLGDSAVEDGGTTGSLEIRWSEPGAGNVGDPAERQQDVDELVTQGISVDFLAELEG